MTRRKMKPCPNCGTDEYLGLYTYESGWSRVECDKCWGIFSCEGTKMLAVKKHNDSALRARASDGGKVMGNKPLFDLSDICSKCGTGHLVTPCSKPCVCRCRKCNARLLHCDEPARHNPRGTGE